MKHTKKILDFATQDKAFLQGRLVDNYGETQTVISWIAFISDNIKISYNIHFFTFYGNTKTRKISIDYFKRN